jgi:hypothetical protein
MGSTVSAAQAVGCNPGIYSISGVAGSIFAGLNFAYGNSPYPEEYPDAINAVSDGAVALRYGNGLNAGVQLPAYFPVVIVPASWLEAGFHHQPWDGLNDGGLPVASGEYFLRMSIEPVAGGRLLRTVKMSVVK